MEYSVIITFYQNINMLWNCIRVLMDTLSDCGDVEVVLVNDNPALDLGPEFHMKEFPVPFKIIQTRKTAGTPVPAEQVWKIARGNTWFSWTAISWFQSDGLRS